MSCIWQQGTIYMFFGKTVKNQNQFMQNTVMKQNLVIES